MSQLLIGKPVASAINEKTAVDVLNLKAQGIIPTIGMLRIGQREEDLRYEISAEKRCKSLGIMVKKNSLDADVDSDIFFLF